MGCLCAKACPRAAGGEATTPPLPEAAQERGTGPEEAPGKPLVETEPVRVPAKPPQALEKKPEEARTAKVPERLVKKSGKELVETGPGPAKAVEALEKGPGKALGAASADFGLRLVRELSGASDSDVFVSPASILIAMGMTYGGADGATRDQIAAVVFPGLEEADVHEGLGLLVRLLQSSSELAGANRLYAQKNMDFERSFLDLCEKKYQSALCPVDFTSEEAREAVKEEINAWVAEATQGLIDQVVGKDSLSKLTRLVFINAVYFKAKWAEVFHEEGTMRETFHVGPGKKLQVDMMKKRCYFAHREDDDVQVLRMPYQGSGKLAMVVFLPKQRFGLPAWLAKTDGKGLQRLMGALEEEDVLVSLPKWRTDSSYDLKAALASLGLRDAFDEADADFSRISKLPSDPLYIAAILHKTFVKVDEAGTEAGAVTVMDFVLNGLEPPSPPKVFKADHPFLFAIVQGPLFLFLGIHTAQ